MSELKDKPQQQILFEEIDVKKEQDSLVPLEEQVVLETDELMELELSQSEDANIEAVASPAKPNWLWRIALSLLFVLVLFETGEFFLQGFEQEPLIASLYAALLAVLSLILGKVVVREYLGLRQYKRREVLQQQVSELLASDNSQSAEQLCQSISEQLPCELVSEQEVPWHSSIPQELSDAEIMRLYSRQVLSKVDQKALDKISKYSTEAVVLVALSPMAILDMMLMLWRNLKMVDEIAHLYGLRLSYWSRISLIKQVFVNMVYAGASELIADVGTDLLGADLLGKLSARLAQGLGAGMLTARLGLKALSLCRPVPFERRETPKLKDIRKKLIGQIKQLSQRQEQE